MSAPETVLAFDFGLKRIGIASGDSLTRSASPRPAALSGAQGPDWELIGREVRTLAPARLIVGAPYNADGSDGSMTAHARDFAAELERRFALPVHLVDERFSSLEATAALKDRRASGARKRRVQRADIDSAAAAVILGRWFAGEGTMTEQLRLDGSLRHLVTLEGLPKNLLERLLERAQSFVRPLGARPAMSQVLAGNTVANLFTEPSTRTRVSFELAAKRLGAQVVNLEVQLSSRVKGESMLDTVYTLEALHVDAFVIRDAEVGVPELVAANVAPHVSVLVSRRGPRRAPDPGPARCAHDLSEQTALRGTLRGHRRGHPPLARGALLLAGTAHARGDGPATPRPARAHARGARIPRCHALYGFRRRP